MSLLNNIAILFLVLVNKISKCFLDYIFSNLHLFVGYCGYLKVTENNTSAEYNPDGNSDFEGYKNEDIKDNVSLLPYSDLDL